MADHTVSGTARKPEKRPNQHPESMESMPDTCTPVARAYREDSKSDLQRLLAHALPDADLGHLLLERPEREQAAIASLAYSMAEGINRQLDVLGVLLSGTHEIDADTLQTVGFLIRNLAQQQDFALQLGASAYDARMERAATVFKQPRGTRSRKRRPKPASAQRAS